MSQLRRFLPLLGKKRPVAESWLRVIAVFKFFKAFALILLYLGTLALLRPRITVMVEDWSEGLPREGETQIVQRLLDGIWSLNHQHIIVLGIATFIAASLFLAEGTGLWLRRHWAEWMTVILSSLLIPVEIYELYSHITGTKALALLLNLAVVAYLVYVIRAQRAAHAKAHATGASASG